MAALSDRRRVALDALAVIALTTALWSVLGPFGVAIAAIVSITWALISAIYAFSVGELLFVVLTTTVAGGLAFQPLVIAQLGFGALLLGAIVGRWPLRPAIVAAVAFAVAAVGFATVYTLDVVWHGVAILAVAYAFTAYTLHRYELVRLDLVTEADR